METNTFLQKPVAEIHLPRWDELPNLDLYMDQVLTFIESTFQSDLIIGEEKILTKTMINNYVKQGVLDAPVKKKYNKLHIASLIVICVLKQIFSISDISSLIQLELASTETASAYDQFCVALEKALAFVFEGKAFEDQYTMTHERYLLKNAVLSFAHKLYVERAYLSTLRSDAGGSLGVDAETR